jgi:hypothetical protein
LRLLLIDGLDCDVGRIGDGFDRRGGIAMLGEQPAGGAQDGLPGLGGPAGSPISAGTLDDLIHTRYSITV